MNLQRLWCVLVIVAFSMPALAATPTQIDSFDDINDTNWVETTGAGYGSYMQQELVAEVNEGAGSMKFDFSTYAFPYRNDEAIRTFSPALDWDSNWEDLAITVWVWTRDPNNTVTYLASERASRLRDITLHD